MDVMGLCLRAAMQSDRMFYTRNYTGDRWTEEERDLIEGVFALADAPLAADSMYNTWGFWKTAHDDYAFFGCRRATWDRCWGGSLYEIAAKVYEYYTKRDA